MRFIRGGEEALITHEKNREPFEVIVRVNGVLLDITITLFIMKTYGYPFIFAGTNDDRLDSIFSPWAGILRGY
jgi:hypothetical protein